MYRNLSLALAAALFLSIGIVSCKDEKKETGSTATGDPKVDKLKLPSGFKAERLFGPSENNDGSWVSMTFDDKGRLLASDQYGYIYRLTLPAIGDTTTKTSVEKLLFPNDPLVANDTSGKKISIGFAQGLLYAFNSLYVMVNNLHNEDLQRKSGLYRLQDTDGDDQFDKITLLKSMKGDGEHGPHSVILSPDKQSLYLVAGNHTDIPPMDAYRLSSNWKEDNLMPLFTDPNGHAVDRKAPGGWIAKTDPEGKSFELISAGYRNSYDIAFNDVGDLFIYDSDMEWNFGLPWYRPTRILHATSGSEYGWRTGTGTWSPVYPDNLPAFLNVGQGSPTNFIWAGNAKFPEKYRHSLLAFDWSFGIIYSVTATPEGASYSSKAEEFISGTPLPLTDGVIGPDGALYFLTGGRRLESDLYRVYYDGKLAEKQTETVVTEESKIRRQLEEYHSGGPKAGAVDFAWPYLKHADRFVRYAARIVLEHQPVKEWQDRVLAEKDPVTLIQGAVSLARQGDPSVKGQLLHTLAGINFGSLSESQQTDLVRAIELTIVRMGMPDAAGKAEIIAYLDAQYPAKNNELTKELVKVLAYLEAPNVVEKTVPLLAAAKDDNSSGQKTFMESSDLIMRNPQYGMDIAGMLTSVPPAQQTYLAIALSNTKTGWTPELREQYFKWFYNAFSFKGGHSFRGYVNNVRKKALENVPKAEFAHYNTLSGDSIASLSGYQGLANAPKPKGPGKRWTVENATPLLDSLKGRDFENGRAMFAATMCLSCHNMKGEGGTSGPDLSQLGTRFSAKDILEAIIDPNKTISDQYGATTFFLKEGGSIIGRLVKEDDNNYSISQNPFAPQILREVPKNSVVRTRVSEISPMLPGLINPLNSEELKDLLAYLVANGNKDNPIYSEK
ncbi:MAG: c-type cytochrome [Chitinophagaceae bacterium]|nr:c-type cytochrome [Chitinophagaceae bacterium]MCW5929371.1 c-type cytochrome [Chitinophagaceae bacterium]